MRTGTSWWRETSSARQYLWVRHALVQGYRVEVNHQNSMVVQSNFHTWLHRSLCTKGTFPNCNSMLVRMKSWKTIRSNISFQYSSTWNGKVVVGEAQKLRKGRIVLGRGKNEIYLGERLRREAYLSLALHFPSIQIMQSLLQHNLHNVTKTCLLNRVFKVSWSSSRWKQTLTHINSVIEWRIVFCQLINRLFFPILKFYCGNKEFPNYTYWT